MRPRKKGKRKGGGGRKRSPGKIRARVEGPGLPTGAKEKTMGATRRPSIETKRFLIDSRFENAVCFDA